MNDNDWSLLTPAIIFGIVLLAFTAIMARSCQTSGANYYAATADCVAHGGSVIPQGGTDSYVFLCLNPTKTP